MKRLFDNQKKQRETISDQESCQVQVESQK